MGRRRNSHAQARARTPARVVDVALGRQFISRLTPDPFVQRHETLQASAPYDGVRRQVPWLVGQGGVTLDVVGRLPEHPPADLADARSHLATLADAADGPIDAVLDTDVTVTQSSPSRRP